MREPHLAVLLVCYAFASFCYSALCGHLGRSAHPLGAYQVYAVACGVWFAIGCVVFRPQRLWPPTKKESLSAVAGVTILTSETLALLMPSSLLTVIAGKAGCLLLPDKTDTRPLWQRWGLAGLTILAVVLASLGKPLRVMLLPLCLATLYTAGHALNLHAVKMAKGGAHSEKTGFIAAKQVLVVLLTLALSSGFSHFQPSAPMTDWRLWVLGLASLCAGLLGTRIILHRTRQGVVFPAYRATSLLCALGAGAARGEKVSLAAVGLALFVICAACFDLRQAAVAVHHVVYRAVQRALMRGCFALALWVSSGRIRRFAAERHFNEPPAQPSPRSHRPETLYRL